MTEDPTPESPDPEPAARRAGPMMGILIGVPISIALWVLIGWLSL
ncbi:hypothetical protein P1X14_08845 [Sphingomonas sp. AOB5]|nr:hypothetical protein [Sphingomonas sp. AOB5]MDF7775351.1 hypothetical protein [Sphingomonas sp. AOB5]